MQTINYYVHIILTRKCEEGTKPYAERYQLFIILKI